MKVKYFLRSCLLMVMFLQFAACSEQTVKQANPNEGSPQKKETTGAVPVIQQDKKGSTNIAFTALNPQDFEGAYELGKAFLNEYYIHKAGKGKLDFSNYILNKNLLKYSNKRLEVETHTLDIVDVSIGLTKVQLNNREHCFYFAFSAVTKNSSDGGTSEGIEMLVSKWKDKLVVSDWYIKWGAGSSAFDERNRPNATIVSPNVWENKVFVNQVFQKAGIK